MYCATWCPCIVQLYVIIHGDHVAQYMDITCTTRGHKFHNTWTSSCTIHGRYSYHLWRFFAIKTFQMSVTVKFKVAIWKLICDFISAAHSNLVSVWSCLYLVPISWKRILDGRHIGDQAISICDMVHPQGMECVHKILVFLSYWVNTRNVRMQWRWSCKKQ